MRRRWGVPLPELSITLKMTAHTLSSGMAVACEDNSRSGGPGSPHLAEICSHSQGPPCLGGGLPELMSGANGPVRIGLANNRVGLARASDSYRGQRSG